LFLAAPVFDGRFPWLGGSVAALDGSMMKAEPAISRSEVDVAVIGAGAAGIAAARRLAAAKIDFVVLEARSRLGGRAWTEAYAGYPLDLGCGWLHSADRNPWVAIAEKAGFTIDRTPAPWTSNKRDLTFSEDQEQDFQRASAAFYDRLEQATEEDHDRPASDFLEPGSPWNELLNAISTYANGAELDLVSVRDASEYGDTGVNWRVREGYGAAISAHGGGLPVMLDSPVTRIEHGGRRVRIESPRGSVNARVAIVTLPTTLIASETVKFGPTLPEKLEAAAGLPLGLADKVLFLLDRPELLPQESRLFGNTKQTGTGAYHLRPLGRPLIEGFFGGRLAREKELESEGALAAFALEELAAQLGNEIRKQVKPLVATAWSRDPFALGSYSHALPGNAGAREVLARPVDDRLFFAGEACSAESFSTAHGAYETGVAAADQALIALAKQAAKQ
jgi:monoamine oxidase